MSTTLINKYKYIHATLSLQHFSVMFKLKCLLFHSLDLEKKKYHSFISYVFLCLQSELWLQFLDENKHALGHFSGSQPRSL